MRQITDAVYSLKPGRKRREQLFFAALVAVDLTGFHKLHVDFPGLEPLQRSEHFVCRKYRITRDCFIRVVSNFQFSNKFFFPCECKNKYLLNYINLCLNLNIVKVDINHLFEILYLIK